MEANFMCQINTLKRASSLSDDFYRLQKVKGEKTDMKMRSEKEKQAAGNGSKWIEHFNYSAKEFIMDETACTVIVNQFAREHNVVKVLAYEEVVIANTCISFMNESKIRKAMNLKRV